MSENKFIPLNEYSSEKKPLLVSETMILEKGEDEDGAFGKIIDRGLSFVPRAMRFGKAKKIMKKSLNKYIKKSKKVIDSFSKSFQTKVATIEPEYKALKKKVDAFVLEGKDLEAKSAMEVHLKELHDYKKDQMQILDNGIQSIFDAYTNAIDQRIDSPGFVLNVDLSEKGKGELKAKWQQLGSIAKMKIDEHKTNLIQSKGWKKIDEIIAEINAFIEQRRYAGAIADSEFFIESLIQNADGYVVKVLFRMSGARLKCTGKGLIFANHSDIEQIRVNFKNEHKEPYVGTNKLQLSGFKMAFSGSTDPETYLVPYLTVKEQKDPIIGQPAQISHYINQDINSNTGQFRDQGDRENNAGTDSEWK